MIGPEPSSPAVPEILAAFNYSSIEGAKAKRAKAAAEYIKSRHNSMVETTLEIGSKLLEVKEDLEHGQFIQWIGAEFAWSVRSAQNYMTAARAFAGKSETVSYLPVSTVYQLARIAEPIREEVVKRIEAEHLPVEDVEEIVWMAKRDHKEAKEAAHWSPEQKARDKARKAKEKLEHEARLLKLNEKNDAEYAANSALAVMIVERFGDDMPALLEAVDRSTMHDLKQWLRGPYGWKGAKS